jgi:hypothetical protein
MDGSRGKKRRCCDCWLGSDKEMDQVLSLCCLSNEKLSNLLIRKEAFFLQKELSLAFLLPSSSRLELLPYSENGMIASCRRRPPAGCSKVQPLETEA